MSEPTPEKKEAPAPVAPKAVELLELSLTALVNAPGVFAKLEARPAPGPGASLLAALAWGAAFFALNLVQVALASPAALQAYAPWQLAAVGALALGVWTSLFLLGASFVYGLGRALGTAGDFDRALLVAAVALAAAPAQALCGRFPGVWIAPALAAGWILACGLSALFKANAWAARAVAAVLAAFVLAAQYGASRLVERYAAGAQLAASAAQAASAGSQLADLQRQLEQAQAISQEAAQTAAAPQGASSLDLLRGPDADAPAPAAPTERQQLAQMSASGDAMNKSVITMLDSIGPMLDNPLITKGMTLQQKSDYVELKRMIQDMKSEMVQNKVTTSREQQAKMTKIQGLVMRLMGGAMTMPGAQPPAPAPAPGAPR